MSIFCVLRLVAEPLALHPPWPLLDFAGPPGPPQDSLDAPAPCAWTPLKLVLLTVLDLFLDPVSLFLTDERSDAAVVGSGNKDIVAFAYV